MIFRLTANVEGEVLLAKTETFMTGGTEVTFAVQSGRIASVSVSRSVSAQLFAGQVKQGVDGQPPTLELSASLDVMSALVDHLRSLGAYLGLAAGGSMRRLRLDELKEERIAESSEEKELVQISALTPRMVQPPPEPVLMTESTLRAVISKADDTRRDDLRDAIEFYLEGEREEAEFKYTQAFYDYYFVVEGLYADGKSSEKEVLRAFAVSAPLFAALDGSFRAFRDKRPKEWKQLEELRIKEGFPEGPEGFLRLLVRLRGQLHHFSPRGRGLKPTSFRQDEIRPLAMYCGVLAMCAIAGQEMVLDGKLSPFLASPANPRSP